MADLEQLVLSIEARTAQFDKALKRVEKNTKTMADNSSRHTKRFGRSIDNLERKMSGFGGRVGGYLKAGLIAKLTSEIAGSFDGMLDVVDRIGKTADKIGLTTDALQELQFAGTQTGVEVRAVDLALQRFSRRTAEAADGSGALYKVFKANGVALRDQEGRMRPLIDLLNDYANIIQSAKSGQEQLRLAFVAFDSEGAAFVNTMRQGADGLEELRSEARRLGIVLGEDLVRDVERINDEFDKLARRASTAIKSVAIETFRLGQYLSEIFSGVDSRGLKTVQSQIQEIEGILDRSAAGKISIADRLDFRSVETLNKQLTELRSRRDQLLAQENKNKTNSLEVDVFKGFGATTEKRNSRRSGRSTEVVTRDKAAEAAARQRDSVTSLIASLDFEAEQLSRTADEQELFNNLNRAGVTLESDYGRAIQEATSALQAKRAITEAAAEAQDRLQEQVRDTSDLLLFFGESGFDAFEDIISGAVSAEDSIKSLALSISRAAAEAALFGRGPLATLFGGQGVNQDSGGIFGQLAAGIVQSFSGVGSLPTPAFRPRMNGGLVLPGMAHTVGEDGPERFVPTHAGRIEPNRPASRNDGNTSDGGVRVYMTVRAQDASSFRQSQGQISAELARAVNRGQRGL